MKSSTLQFLKTLEKNNNRDWFNTNKDLYTVARQDVISFIEELQTEISGFDPEVLKMDAAKSLFRIYRDTRFSLDKTPYKTNFGASLGMGKGSQRAGYYLHVEPGRSFVSGGLYQPDSAVLKTLRKFISANNDAFQKILGASGFRNNFRGLSTESKLQRVPAGFEKEDPVAEFLKLKQFVVSHPVSDTYLLDKDAPQKLAGIFKSMKPLNDFLNSAFS
ncbi:DUF2461 domain-containing protein [Kaistella palustris]|uniref:DUF2461 domain-containing protein n=1 Tax=Kaistella palustris TaxID=493376 RepID=UPI00040CC0AA|nr:DUF2461 domain-containing protein [Kaistella palustris]